MDFKQGGVCVWEGVGGGGRGRGGNSKTVLAGVVFLVPDTSAPYD